MNAQGTREVEVKDAEGTVERIVETTDYRSSAGRGQEQRTGQVVHRAHPKTSGGVLADAAAAVTSTLQSAKDAISRT